MCREAALPADERDPNILLSIIESGTSTRASHPLTGAGLALCGVGFDLDALAIYKNMPKSEKQRILANKSQHA